jgi:AraC-like DNA-binding protein
LKIWHYHPEFELVYISKSKGTLFIGNSIEIFEEGDLVLIGRNLPHMWLNDDMYFEDSPDLIAEATAVHFKESFLGREFFELPEMVHISRLFAKARRGVKFVSINKDVIDSIQGMLRVEGFERTMGFVRILDLLARHTNFELLASEGYVNASFKNDKRNLDRMYAYIFKNFTGSISLVTVAEIVHMNPSAFSRFFKRLNHKTFSKYINEIRVGYACKLLIENKDTITSICYESGYNNISNFNRQFRSVTRMSPSEYLEKYNKIGTM